MLTLIMKQIPGSSKLIIYRTILILILLLHCYYNSLVMIFLTDHYLFSTNFQVIVFTDK